MKSVQSSLFALACAAFLSTSAAALEVGEQAPSFALPTAAGDTVRFEGLRGKAVYVDFWASWCGPCRQSFPWMNEMQRRDGSQGLSIVAINVDRKRDDATRFLSEVPADFTVLYDAPGATPA
ncbi:MAG TPA: TlpA disulfide reductase family protein, partial [Casimicrobiaceae bacterium]